MGFAAKRMGKGQGVELLSNCGAQFLIAVAQRCAPEPGHAFYELIARVIKNIDAFATNQIELLNRGQVCGWVYNGCHGELLWSVWSVLGRSAAAI